MHFADFYFAGLTNINLHLSLVGFHTFTTAESDPTGNETAGSVLRNFINYHSENLKEFPTHDNAVLLITRDFTKSSSFIGLTHVGTQCNMWGSGTLFSMFGRFDVWLLSPRSGLWWHGFSIFFSKMSTFFRTTK